MSESVVDRVSIIGRDGNVTFEGTGHEWKRAMNKVAKALEERSSSELPVDMTVIRISMPLLEEVCRKKIEAGKAFAESCKAVSEKAHINSTVLAQYVNAVVIDKLEEHKQKAEQMQLLLED